MHPSAKKRCVCVYGLCVEGREGLWARVKRTRAAPEVRRKSGRLDDEKKGCTQQKEKRAYVVV